GGVRTRVSRINHVDLMSAIVAFKFALKNSGVIVFKTAVPPERIAQDDNSENTGRFLERVIPVVETELVGQRSVITSTVQPEAGWVVGPDLESHVRIVLKSSLEEIRIEQGHQKLNGQQ